MARTVWNEAHATIGKILKETIASSRFNSTDKVEIVDEVVRQLELIRIYENKYPEDISLAVTYLSYAKAGLKYVTEEPTTKSPMGWLTTRERSYVAHLAANAKESND